MCQGGAVMCGETVSLTFSLNSLKLCPPIDFNRTKTSLVTILMHQLFGLFYF